MVRMLKDWSVALLIAAIVFVAVSTVGGDHELPDQAPAFHLVDLEGNAVELGSYEGKTLVLNFWATWCGPCRQEIPEFAAFHEEHPEVEMLGVAVSSGKEADVRRTAQKWGISWPVALANHEATSGYKIDTLPTTVIIGPAGEVRHANVGTMSQSQLERALD